MPIGFIGFGQVKKIDEAFLIFRILMQAKIDPTPPSCALLINYLCRSWKLESALDVMFYTLDTGFIFDMPVANCLLKKLCLRNKKDAALELAERMHLSGYDYLRLRATTEILLYG